MVAIERQFKLHALVAVEKGDVQRIILFIDGQSLFITVIFAVRILFGYINTYSVNNLGDCQVFHVLFEWSTTGELLVTYWLVAGYILVISVVMLMVNYCLITG